MAESRERRKPESSSEAKPKSWWARNGGAVKQGADAGFWSGCLPVLVVMLALPLGLFF
ncbi:MULTISPECIES: hypothetical protein [unclassified Novosphingobium]|uniref:hypothetical protein n=1 Tax=unclassified Novosphingobium TaxID=2644732 RepID=UPI0025FFD456|nr:MULTISPECIES: hypothetical protein [unclassified Novosphingobium]HQV04807.1 hypothetical protein [Novosphingobium sp.]